MAYPDLPAEERSIWEKPGAIRAIWAILILGCLGSAIYGFILASQHRLGHDPHFDDKIGLAGVLGAVADNFPVFYGLVGFVSFSFIVLAGQHLRKILMREEGYYDGDEAREDKKSSQ